VKNSLNSKGFTLIEVLVALVILAVSLLALAGLMTTTTKNNASGGHLTEAATFAQDKLEELRAMPWNSLIPGSVNTDLVPNPPGSTGIQYTRTYRVNQLNPSLKELEITINWNDAINRSITFFSVLSNPENT